MTMWEDSSDESDSSTTMKMNWEKKKISMMTGTKSNEIINCLSPNLFAKGKHIYLVLFQDLVF